MSRLAIFAGAFLMALAGAAVGIMLFNTQSIQPAGQVSIVTVPVIITATPDPNATIPVIIITATVNRTQIAVPGSVAQAVDGITVIAPTLDATLLAANPSLAETQISLPANCILHTIASGDSPFGIAEQYAANGFDVLAANGLTEETSTLLQIGDVLIVPLADCPLDQLPSYLPQSLIVAGISGDAEPQATVSEGTPQPTSVTATNAPLVPGGPTATITLAPTATNAKVTITGVEKAGDVTAEGVSIRNTGSTVNMTGWRLTDANGQTYTFKEYILFSNASVTVFTRVGQDTPIALYWGQDEPIWGDAGDVVTLSDAQGNVQATTRLAGITNLTG